MFVVGMFIRALPLLYAFSHLSIRALPLLIVDRHFHTGFAPVGLRHLHTVLAPVVVPMGPVVFVVIALLS